MLPLQWLAADLLTGQITCFLPSVTSDEPFRRTLGQYETQTVKVVVTDKIDPNWIYAIDPWTTVFVAYRGDPGSEVIEWAGIVNQEVRDLGNTAQVALITIEGYLDRCQVGDYAVTGRDQNLIVTDLIAAYVAGTVHGLPGVPVSTQVIGSAGVARDRTYHDTEDKTVYSVLTDLMNVQGGPEWTMHWAWMHGPERILPYLQVGTRIGAPVDPGRGRPAVVFEAANLLGLTATRSWAAGSGANIVTATSSGQGDDRPQATSVAASPRRPHIEYRWSPSSSITDPATLQAYADAKVSKMVQGSVAVQLVAAIQKGRTLGVDWNLGDDVGYAYTGPSFPQPLEGTARCVAYEVTAVSATPILATASA